MKKLLSDSIVDVLVAGKRRYGSNASLARLLGVSEVNLGRWISQKQKPKVSEIENALDILGAKLVMQDEQLIDFDLIPKVEAVAGAGASEETSGTVEGLYAFRSDFMGSQNISKNSVLMDVRGDSMLPTIHDGDTVLIDKSDTELRDGYIYVIRYDTELRVKRIQKSASGGVIIRSDNNTYTDERVEGDDLQSLAIIGRVRWIGRML